MGAGVRDRHRGTKLRRHADVKAKFEFVIEAAGSPVDRHDLLGALRLPVRTAHRSAAHRDRRGPAVIGDRNEFVVRQQRIVGAEHAARIGGVKNRGEEIRKIADLRRHRQFCFIDWREMPLDAAAPLASPALLAQQARERETQCRPGRGATFHQGIKLGRRTGRGSMCGLAVHEIGDGRNVEHGLPDGNADPRRRAAAAPAEHAVRQVLNREIAIGRVGGGDEAFERRIVSFVECHAADISMCRTGFMASLE